MATQSSYTSKQLKEGDTTTGTQPFGVLYLDGDRKLTTDGYFQVNDGILYAKQEGNSSPVLTESSPISSGQISGLSLVATTGDYDNLLNVPLFNGGVSSFTATNIQTVFVINHGLGVVPDSFSLTPMTTASAALYFATVDTTNITITYIVGRTLNASISFSYNVYKHQ